MELLHLYVYGFCITLVFSAIFCKVMIRVALQYNIVANPQRNRLHTHPVPLLGGVAIVGSFYFVIVSHACIIMLFPKLASALPEAIKPYILGGLTRISTLFIIMLGGGLIFLLGLIDDLKVLGPKRKFVFQIILGLILYWNGVRITIFLGDGWPSLFITVAWVVAITNAFNLLDNIDGLSSGIAIIASLFLFLLCVQGGNYLICLLLVIFAGSVCGFLRYNYNPAKIFMGDAGSLFIGYMISVLMIMTTFHVDQNVSLVPIAAPLLILAVPIYDTVSVICIRIKRKKSIFSGDKNHFSHRLLRLGMSQRGAVLFIYLVSLCLGIAALTLVNTDIKNQIILLFQALGLLMIIHLLEKERKEEGDK